MGTLGSNGLNQFCTIQIAMHIVQMLVKENTVVEVYNHNLDNMRYRNVGVGFRILGLVSK